MDFETFVGWITKNPITFGIFAIGLCFCTFCVSSCFEKVQIAEYEYKLKMQENSLRNFAR